MLNSIGKLEDKKILILGLGREGESTKRFLLKYFPDKTIDIADQKQSKDYLDNLEKYDVIFKSPGIPYKLPQIQKAKKAGVEFTSQTKLFFEICKGEIIGITGTKGKSTTTTLIHHILTQSGKDAVLLGNIGKPSLDYLDDNFGEGKIFCFELSSYQLSDLDKSPHIAVLLNIYRDHLDHHVDFDDYFKSKQNITLHQQSDDFFIYNDSQEELTVLSRKTKAKSIPLSSAKGLDTINNPLKGKHNLSNIKAAFLVSQCLEIDKNTSLRAIHSFKPLSHRLELVGEYKNIRFYDDSLATIPEATIAAIKAFKGEIGSLILGGTDRGQDFAKLAKIILEEKIPTVVLFPTTGERIWKEIEKNSLGSPLPHHVLVDSMEKAVAESYKHTPKNSICLLSTASPSFTLFRDYEHKALEFKKWVEYFAKIN